MSIALAVSGNPNTSETVTDFLTYMPLLAQWRLSIAVAKTEKGLIVLWLQLLKALMLFFMLMNVVRLFSSSATNSLSCQLADVAFEAGTDQPSDLRCAAGIRIGRTFSIVIYSLLTLMQGSCLNRLETSFMERLRKLGSEESDELVMLAGQREGEEQEEQEKVQVQEQEKGSENNI
jgi:hypothetical protein